MSPPSAPCSAATRMLPLIVARMTVANFLNKSRSCCRRTQTMIPHWAIPSISLSIRRDRCHPATAMAAEHGRAQPQLRPSADQLPHQAPINYLIKQAVTARGAEYFSFHSANCSTAGHPAHAAGDRPIREFPAYRLDPPRRCIVPSAQGRWGVGLTRSRWMSITSRKALALRPLPPRRRGNGTPVKGRWGVGLTVDVQASRPAEKIWLQVLTPRAGEETGLR